MDDERRGGGEQGRLESGAGLQESRLNQDFINWLEKWGPRVLYVILAVVVTYVGLQWYGRYQERLTDEAFASLREATEARDVGMLEAVAAEHADRGAVSDLARLELGRLLQIAGTTRIPETVQPGDEDVERLDVSQAEGRLRAALEQFEMVVARSSADRPLLAQQARWGMVSAHMSLGDGEAASRVLEAYVEAAEGLGLAETQRRAADERLALIESGLGGLLELPTREDLPELAREPEAAAPEEGADAGGGMGSVGAGGEMPEIDPRDPFAGTGLEVTDGDEGGDGGGGDEIETAPEGTGSGG